MKKTMKFAHNITVSVFCKSEDDYSEVKKAIVSLVPLDLENEKIAITEQNASGFNDHSIKIIEIRISKESHTNLFMKSLAKNLGDQTKKLADDAETRIDDELILFIRLDKDSLIRENAYKLTDSGNCFHIRISLAAFPKKKEKAITMAKEFFSKA